MIRVVTHTQHSMRESTITGDDMKKTTTGKQNKPAADPKTGGKDPKKKVKAFNGFKTEGPKTTEGINLDLSGYPEDEKGNKIIPDDIFEENYKHLPNGTKNESGTYRAFNKGKLGILGTDPETDKEIQRKGAEALNAAHAQRRTLAETIDVMLRRKAPEEIREAYNLPEGATLQDAATLALLLQATKGNVKAFATMRDTAGEMPVSKQEITADVMTAADRALVEKLSRRLDGQ